MISVVIPTLNAASRLGASLEALAGAAVDGLVREAIVVDGGSADATTRIADVFGARILAAPPGRGGQLRAGAEAARGDWLLFLHGDTALEEGWAREAGEFIGVDPGRAAVFTLRFDAEGLAPRLVAAGAMLRTKIFKSPYGDQGLLISRRLYDAVGGYSKMPLFEDVDIVSRIVRQGGRGALHVLQSKAVTSAERYERDGYGRCVARNAWRLLQYHAGVPAAKIFEGYR